ncbi:hypothetical protein ABB37_03763 [Leptomonas pyrrhocoris]|uniref:Nucleoporin n=1 Tax=Leptomonas pyrrhocoris TaxID=157538 RepID=A0A0N0DW66_LEPPY|nr:hypothetical protein ABB37_03763 [Leptomonas pyrrhocoris]KPA81384.1 hypothetical protein ABB37_03763 [Leptomonas pyrrhocoris]|eukprot:XP_015659823.1 hypothetical protein ABB37_03763 [Leptomonas pyrrhocoris]
MEGKASDQGPSQRFSLSPGEALLCYDPKQRHARLQDFRAEETRPMLANRYFSVDNAELWKPSLLQSFGGTCHRATYVNDFHVLLCNRRLVLVDSNGRHLTFPPFEEPLNDAYAERISEHCVLVIVALTSEVHVALISDGEGQRTDMLQSVACRTTFPVARIHHFKKGLYGLCCDNCTLESLSIKLRNARSLHPQLEANILASRWELAQVALDYVSKERYVHSFFDHYKGYLLLLSNSRLLLWMYRDESHMRLESSLNVSRISAAAVVAPLAEQDEEEQIAVLITSSGGRVPLYLVCDLRKPLKGPTLAFGEVSNLPKGVANASVSMVTSCGTSLLIADQATASLVLSTQCELFCEAYRSPISRVVSQLFLGKRICGVGARRRSGDDGDFVTFFVYCGDSTVVLIRRVPRGQLLQRQFSASATNGISALRLLDPVTRVDVLLDAALGGLSLQHVSDCLNPLLLPREATPNVAELSDGAKGIVRHTMRNLGELSRLCSSFQYWRLSEELTQSRSKLEKCCDLLTKVLHCDGWLDCPLGENWKWSSNFAVALPSENASSRRSALNAQAELLQLLLTSLRSAATIAWLYEMMLQSDLTYRFPGRLEDMLWKGDPSAIETTFCMDLLALSNKEVTDKLIQSRQELPQRCRLAATLLSLVLADSFDRVTAYVREHILDIARCDLLAYTNEVIETHFPGSQSRLLLLVYYYPHHRSASSDIVALVERIASVELLHRTLSAILHDPACDDDLTAVLLDWMESHSLADSRIPTFAQVVVEANLNVDPAHTLAGRFFSSCKQETAGHGQQASFRFGELARSELAVPLAGRLLSAEHALQATPSDVDRVTQFVLLLQQQLANLIDEHLQNGKNLLFTRSSIENDLALLREHYLGENRLFELSGRYKALGGCSIQLDLLKIHPDSAPFAIASAITGVLTFLTAVGLPATEAVRRVLREYLDSFQAPLPLFPFVEFLAFDGQSPSTTIHELAAAGVQLPVLFDTFMSLLDGHNNPLFPLRETVAAVAQLVPKIDMSVQHICAAHLLECSRSLLDGDQRTVSLSDEDEAFLKEIGDEMRRLSQQTSR